MGTKAVVYNLDSFLDSVIFNKAPFPQPQAEVQLHHDAYIRQVAFHQNLCLITESPIDSPNHDPRTFKLHMADLRLGKEVATLDNVTSAIFNEAGTHVLASTYSCEDNILILNRETLA